MKQAKLKKIAGFTLIELMIVVAIVSLLSTLALPKFKRFQAKAMQTEAKVNLSSIATLQEVYRLEHGKYASIPQSGSSNINQVGFRYGTGERKNVENPLGFTIQNLKKVRYGYFYLEGGIIGGTQGISYHALAYTGINENNAVFPGCPVSDYWAIVDNLSTTVPINLTFNALDDVAIESCL